MAAGALLTDQAGPIQRVLYDAEERIIRVEAALEALKAELTEAEAASLTLDRELSLN
jgi:hypothetical protein